MKHNVQRTALSLVLAVAPLALPASVAEATGGSPGRPNIILIMADDMGIECVSAHGSLDYKTPVLDRLAAQGIRFNHCYSTPICTPSRVKIMTGRYGFRNYQQFGLLPPTEVTFGNRMQTAGYNTCIVGKWQLKGGHQGVLNFGFDEYCLFNGISPIEEYDRSTRGTGSRYWGYPPIVANGKLYESSKTFGPDMVNEYAVGFIKRKRDKPFFLYYPMIAPHAPWAPSPLSRDGDKTGARCSEVRFFKDMIEYIDVLVGNVVRALEESGQRENTLIMFTGDNGTGYPSGVTAPSIDTRRVVAMNGRSNTRIVEAGTDSGKPPAGNKKGDEFHREGPVTRTTWGDVPGGKSLMTNGGTHVPLIVDWPRHAAAYRKHGNECDDLIDFSDFFTTVIELGGGKLPEDRKIDGVSFASRLQGKGANERNYIFCHYWGFGRNPEEARDSIHDGRWKLYNNGDFHDLKKDRREEKPLQDDELIEVAMVAKARLIKSYTDLRKLPFPNDKVSDKKRLDSKAAEKKKKK